MKAIDPYGPDVRSRARLHRSGSYAELSHQRHTLLTSPSWRWLPVFAVPLLFTGRANRARPDERPPPADDGAAHSTAAPVLPIHMNARVEKWVHRFRTDQRPIFQALLDREGLYASMIRRKLRERGMPEDLFYLAMMESGLSPRAVSGASAVGIWQLMVPTALQCGLRVDEWIDERRDPIRATDAALDYLQWLYDRYGSWYLAAAAYNAGPGRMDRILERYADGSSGDEGLYWKVIGYLPPETRDYVPRMVAATYLAQYADAFGFENNEVAPYRYDRVFVPGGTPLSSVARSLGVDTDLLRRFNPHLIRGVTPPDETYPVRVPVGDSGKVVAALELGSRIRSTD